MHFDLTDLRLFVSLAEEENLTRGASRIALSPGAASARLKSLEAQLEQPLFYRERHGLSLAPAGKTLLRHARTILRQVEHAASDLSAATLEIAGHFRIFANTTAITEVLPKFLATFLSGRPAVTVDIQERNTREVIRGVLDNAADVGITSGPVALAGLQSQCFSIDRLILLAPPGHPLAGAGRATFPEAARFPHVGLRESTLQQFLVKTAAGHEGRLEMRVLMGSFEAMYLMIEAGVGVGILPESAARRLNRDDKLRIISLDEPWAIRERRIVYRELDALPPCARTFINDLVQETRPAPGA